MRIRRRSVRALAAIVALHVGPVATSYAQIVELMSKADSGTISETTGGNSSPHGISADGRYVVFESAAVNLSARPNRLELRPDVFLYDRITEGRLS